MVAAVAAWLTVAFNDVISGALLEPTPGPSGFDWDRVHPDPAAVPGQGALFYTLVNAVMFIGIAAAIGGFVSGAIAFGVGPIFGAHIVSDRGKSMMWKGGLIALSVGTGTTIIAFLLALR
jgi:hypothetical protein